MAKPDLTYFQTGMFVAFWPETPAGESAWNVLAAQSNGTGKFLFTQQDSVIAQLRAAGYRVAKAKPVKPAKPPALDAILKELDPMLGDTESTQ